MDQLPNLVGRKIRFFRKAQGLSVEQLAGLIQKSKATVYKYESGEIPIDLSTLGQVALALKVEPAYFFELPSVSRTAPARISFFDTPKLYAYYYDGRIKQEVKSLLSFRDGEGSGQGCTVSFFMNVKEFSLPESARYIYSGTLSSHETVTYCILENMTLPIETLIMEIVHPFQTSKYTWGLFLGLSDQPLAPMAAKFLISKAPLSPQELKECPLKFSKEELARIRQQNAILLSIRETDGNL